MSQSWVKDSAVLAEPRMQSAAATLGSDWVVTGGFNWDFGLEETTNERYSGSSFTAFDPDIPRGAYRHVVVALKDGSSLFMAGGNVASDQMHIYSGSSWSTETTTLPAPRANVAAGLGSGDRVRYLLVLCKQ